MRIHPGALALALISILPACYMGRASQNDPLSEVDIARLEPGKTTSRDVVEMLGAPADIVQLGRRSAYLYSHTVEKTSGVLIVIVGLYNEDRRSDRLWVFFDEDGVLSHYGSTLAAKRASHNMPWRKLHGEEEGDEDVDVEVEEEKGAGGA